MHSMHPSQSTLLTGSPAMQLAQTAGIPIAGPSRLNTLVPSRENRQHHGHVSMICWIMPTDNANVAQSCALRCQFVMCNLHMQSWQAASLNAWLPMCMPLQMAGPACNHTICYVVSVPCPQAATSGDSLRYAERSVLSSLVPFFSSVCHPPPSQCCAARSARLCVACYRGSDQVLETSRSRNQVFEDVQLGPLLGQGGYGKVYRGLWNKTPVAVKV